MVASFDKMFEDLYNSVKSRSESVQSNKSESHLFSESRDGSRGMESFEEQITGPQEEFLLQTQIRPLFGKEGVNDSPIGTPPDFISLEGTASTQRHYTCTLFVDIKGSTRLSLLYDLEFVFTFKNAVIQACVEVIRSFDGHVHRLMGDAVMAFFGGSHTEKEDAVADAINCCITLRAILEGSIKPWMAKEGLEYKDFGFRVGCDFGDDQEVLWGSFGYRNVGEVSATGLPVDMASKLQGLASKNQTMLGQGLLDFVNWPDKYSATKTRDKDGVNEEVLFVTPNISDSNGNKINYRMKQLVFEKSLEFSALPTEYREKVGGAAVKGHTEIEYYCFTRTDGNKEKYISASKFLEPDKSLLFVVRAKTSNRLKFPLKAIFSKTNHGQATPESERGIEQPGITYYLNKEPVSQFNKSPALYSTAELDEATLYRGLHTMKCEVFESDGTLLFRDWIGVMIK